MKRMQTLWSPTIEFLSDLTPVINIGDFIWVWFRNTYRKDYHKNMPPYWLVVESYQFELIHWLHFQNCSSYKYQILRLFIYYKNDHRFHPSLPKFAQPFGRCYEHSPIPFHAILCDNKLHPPSMVTIVGWHEVAPINEWDLNFTAGIIKYLEHQQCN